MKSSHIDSTISSAMGGGNKTTSLTSSLHSSQNKSSKFFKPVFATSLLFALSSLGMSASTLTVGDTGPKITITTNESSQDTNLKWSSTCSDSACATTTGGATTSWTLTNNTWGGTVTSSTSGSSSSTTGNIANLILRFDNTNTSTQTKSYVYNNLTGSGATSVFASPTNASDITADFEGKSLGTSNNNINLDLQFGSTATTNKNITVKNLDTLNGTLFVRSGTTGTTVNVYTYDITLNTLNGTLAIQGSNYSLKGTITINKALNGNIYLSGSSTAGPSTGSGGTKISSYAALTLKFVDGATMTGDIADRESGYAGIRKDIYFYGSGNVLTGNIVSFGTNTGANYINPSTGNRIYFTQGDMTGYIIAGTGQTSSSENKNDTNLKGFNVVIFGDTTTTTTQNLNGGILASDVSATSINTDTNTQQAFNTLILADKTTLNINGSGDDTVSKIAGGAISGGDNGANNSSTTFKVTKGSIVARNFGVNEIRIYSNSTLNLDNGNGSIKSVVNDLTTANTSVSNASALNRINFLSENGVINGSIVADNSNNTSASSGSTTNQASALIYVANNASGTITGNLETKPNSSSSGTSTNGRLTITLGSSNIATSMTSGGTAVTVKGGQVTNATTNTTAAGTATLTLQGSSNTITGLTTTGVNSSGTTTTTSGDAVNTASLVFDSSKSESGQTTTISGTITNNAKALNLVFKGDNKSTLDLSSASGGESNIDIEVKEGVSAVIATKDTPSPTVNHTITFASGTTGSLTIGKKDTASASATDSSVTVASNSSLSVSSNTLTLNFYGSGTLNDGLTVSSTGTAAIFVGGDDGGVSATLNGVLTNSGTTTQATSSTSAINLTFNGNNNTLNLNGTGSSTSSAAGSSVSQTIDTLSGTGSGNVINLSASGDTTSRTTFQTLTVKSLTASSPTTFLLYVNPNATTTATVAADSSSTTALSDKVVIEGNGSTTTQDTDTSTPSTVHYLSITGNTADLVGKDLRSKNIALATVKNGSNITLKEKESVVGFNVVKFTMDPKSTDSSGNTASGNGTNDYTTYFLGTAYYAGIDEKVARAVRPALALGYNLFLANFNSLNKRMGELRNNAHSQGVWGRIFSGMESINFSSAYGLSSNTFYTTVQTGYDYAFGFNGANNFVGVALSYANTISDLKSSSISSSYSNGVELAIYNSYIQDGASKATHWKNGFYNDNILKLSGIFSNADINGSNMTFSQFGITFSEEAGYRFLLGENNEWYVTPQGELSLGYLTGSGFNYSADNYTLAASQSGIFMLRARIGSDVGYDFKKFTEGKNFDARAYLGLYYTGDYITGGDVALASNGVSTPYVVLNSTNRLVMNLGTNFNIKEQHRVYFDFERSFGGSIVTQYQFNVGYRYSFGESKYTPYSGITSDVSVNTDALREVAPSAGYYIKLFSSSKPSKKELRVLKGIENLKVKVNGDSKDYLIGPFKTEDQAQKEKTNYEGTLKEVNSTGDVIEVE